MVHFALEMALLFQLLPLAIVLRSRVLRQPIARLTATAAALFLVATWAFHLPAVPRLYLPTLALIVPVSAAALHDLLPPEARTRALLGYALANFGIAAIGIFTG